MEIDQNFKINLVFYLSKRRLYLRIRNTPVLSWVVSIMLILIPMVLVPDPWFRQVIIKQRKFNSFSPCWEYQNWPFFYLHNHHLPHWVEPALPYLYTLQTDMKYNATKFSARKCLVIYIVILSMAAPYILLRIWEYHVTLEVLCIIYFRNPVSRTHNSVMDPYKDRLSFFFNAS